MNVKKAVRQAYKIGMAQIPAEAKMFATFIDNCKPTNLMEIGTNKGGMFYLLCLAANEEGVKISLDLPCDRWGNKFNVDKRNKMMKSWADHVNILEGNSGDPKFVQEVERILNGRELDILFIDGDHSYEGVKRDYNLYSQFVRSGGYIGFHDINDTAFHKRQGCIVSQFWNELKGEKVELNTFNKRWGGIGILRKE